MFDAVIIGAGAAGLLAAARCGELGGRVLLLEKNRKAGVKILISGGTRCNLTHHTDSRGIVDAFGKSGRFLHSPLASLGPDELVALFDREGVPTKVEATGKVFPISDRALDVQRALVAMVRRVGVELALDEPVLAVDRQQDHFLIATAKREVVAAKLLIAVGGKSYPGCGTTGDGYQWAKSLGHKIVSPKPALVPLTTPADWVHQLAGVTLEDVIVSAGCRGRKPLMSRRASLLLTHKGLSGPAAMDVSRVVSGSASDGEWEIACDFLPDVHADQLLHRLGGSENRSIVSVLSESLPKRLVQALLRENGVDPEVRQSEFSKRERQFVVAAMKRQPIPISGTLGFPKAEVTAGGVDLKEIRSQTMESKLVPNLYFAGEILDLDGPIGGYNFQAAFSTGWLAGEQLSLS